MSDIKNGPKKSVRRAVIVSAAAMGIIATTAAPSFANGVSGYNKSCPSGRIIVTHSYAQQNVTHQVTLSGTLKSRSFTHTGWSYYDDYFYTGWQNADSWAVVSNADVSAGSADCVS
nr:hypothetical protein GCM10020063_090850 [Dactylosporangium thailandense]